VPSRRYFEQRVAMTVKEGSSLENISAVKCEKRRSRHHQSFLKQSLFKARKLKHKRGQQCARTRRSARLRRVKLSPVLKATNEEQKRKGQRKMRRALPSAMLSAQGAGSGPTVLEIETSANIHLANGSPKNKGNDGMSNTLTINNTKAHGTEKKKKKNKKYGCSRWETPNRRGTTSALPQRLQRRARRCNGQNPEKSDKWLF